MADVENGRDTSVASGQNKTGPQRRTGWPHSVAKYAASVLRLLSGWSPSGRLWPELYVGGAEEIRTPDLRRAKAALSQLSYGPSRDLNSQYAMALRLTAILLASRLQDGGGPFWTRTRDLSLIRTAL